MNRVEAADRHKMATMKKGICGMTGMTRPMNPNTKNMTVKIISTIFLTFLIIKTDTPLIASTLLAMELLTAITGII